MRAEWLGRPAVGVLSGWLDQPVWRAEGSVLRNADREGLFGYRSGCRGGEKLPFATRLRLTVRRDLQPHSLDIDFDWPEVPQASLDFEGVSRDHMHGAAAAFQS